MTQMAIVTDLDRCTGCHACTVACKMANGVPIGKYWTRTVRVGPFPTAGGSGNWPDIDMYFVPLGCQHCAEAPCAQVCPTGATTKDDDGVVSIDAEACIGCQLCIGACPYNVRYLNEDTNVVEKCTMCKEHIEAGEYDLPRCVSQCCGMARWYGDLDEGIETFRGPRGEILGDYLKDFDESMVYKLPDQGNGPSNLFILRKMEWQGTDKMTWEGIDYDFMRE